MWREGSKGIYAVKTGKYAGSISLGHIYALDKQSALEIANTCFQYMVEKDDRIFVSFVSIAGPEKISKFNEPIERKLRDRQKHIEEVVASSEEDLEQIKHHLTDWMDSKLLQSQWVPGPELLERSVRVEEELKH